MIKTKDRILATSIRLFNKHGITAVSLRQIADSMGISHGNLAYHYKNKSVIIQEIYTRMDQEMSNAVFPGFEEADLFHCHRLLHRISEFQSRHRFFYMDMLEISRRFPKVIKRYRETIRIRRIQTVQLFDALIAKGLIAEEPEIGFYRSLSHAIWVMSTFWLQQEHILGKNHPAIKSGSDIKHIWEILFPHLTEDGLKEFRRLNIMQESNGRSVA